MINSIDLISLETRVRVHINEPTTHFWTQANAFSAINAEVENLFSQIIALDKGYGEVVVTPTPAASYSLPYNCLLIRNVELYIDSGWMQPRIINDHARGGYQATTSTTYPYAVRIQDNTIHFENGIGSASQMRVSYVRMPAEMVYATLASGSATTAVFGSGAVSEVDDIYIGDRFLVLSGTGAGQMSTVADWAGSTRTATVASGATLDSTTVVSWLLPEPLAKFSSVVVYGAAINLLFRRRDDNLMAMLAARYERARENMLSVLGQRQSQQAEHGNYIPTGDEG